MMGLTHCTMGLAAGTISASFLAAPPPVKVAWVAVATGYAIASDLDHQSASAAKMWGPLTAGWRPRMFGKRRTVVPGATHVISALAGGHRKGTHHPVGVGLLLLVVWASQFHPVATAMVFAFAIGLVILSVCVLLDVNPRKVWVGNLAASGIGAWYLTYEMGWTIPFWLGPAMALGVVVHMFGDMCTEQGLQITREVRWRLMTINTNGPVERFVVLPLTWVATVWWLAWWELELVPGPHVVAGRLAGALFGGWV